MKNVLVLTAFFASTTAFAQESCFKATYKQTEYKVCDSSSSIWIDCYSTSHVCYVGSPEILVSKINAGDFNSGDNGLIEASVTENQFIQFTTWDVGTSCDLVAQPCK